MTIFSASCRWPAQPRRSTMQVQCSILQESYSLWSLKDTSACLHPPDLHGYKLTQTNKSDIIWLYTFTHPFKMFKLTYRAHAWHILQVWQSKWPHLKMVSCQTLSKYPQCSYILHTCQPIYSPQRHSSPNRFEWWYDDEYTCPLPSAITLSYAFSIPTKVTEFGHTPSCCICRNSSSAFCLAYIFTCPNIMVLQVTTTWDGILLNTPQASSRLPHFAYMSTKLFPTKISDLQPLWMSC